MAVISIFVAILTAVPVLLPFVFIEPWTRSILSVGLGSVIFSYLMRRWYLSTGNKMTLFVISLTLTLIGGYAAYADLALYFQNFLDPTSFNAVLPMMLFYTLLPFGLASGAFFGSKLQQPTTTSTLKIITWTTSVSRLSA
jgi:hypothetical protein